MFSFSIRQIVANASQWSYGPILRVACCVPTSEGARLATGRAVQNEWACVSLVRPRFSGALRCLAAMVSAVRISSGLSEDNCRNSKQCLEFLQSVEHQAMCHSVARRRPPATPNERWFRGLRAPRTPHIGIWELCRRRDRGAPVWDDRSRCSAVARRQRHEAERSSAGTLLRDAHGKVATVEVGAIKSGNSRVGAFLRLHLDEAETS